MASDRNNNLNNNNDRTQTNDPQSSWQYEVHGDFQLRLPTDLKFERNPDGTVKTVKIGTEDVKVEHPLANERYKEDFPKEYAEEKAKREELVKLLQDEPFKDPPSYIATLNKIASAGKKRENASSAILSIHQSPANQSPANHSPPKQSLGAATIARNYKLNYSAIQNTTGVAVTQLTGIRYHDQQDYYAANPIPEFAQLDESSKASVLKNTVKALNEEAAKNPSAKDSGTTLCSVTIQGPKIYTSSLGDSLAYACIVDEKGDVKNLVRLNQKLHKPSDESEIAHVVQYMQTHKPADKDDAEWRKEIVKVEQMLRNPKNGRLNGELAISGAIGDTSLTKYGLRHEPENIDVTDLRELGLSKGDKVYILVGCDGLTERPIEDKKETPTKGKETSKRHSQDTRENQIENQLLGLLRGRGRYTKAEDFTKRAADIAFSQGSTDNITVLAKEVDVNAPTPTYLAVFDGHGGHEIAEMASKSYERCMKQEIDKVILYQELLKVINVPASNQANLIEWRRERTSLPASFFFRNSLPTEIQSIKDAMADTDKSPLERLQIIQGIVDKAIKSYNDKGSEKSSSPTKNFIEILSTGLNNFETDPLASLGALREGFKNLYGENIRVELEGVHAESSNSRSM